IPAFQAGRVGSIPITRSRKTLSVKAERVFQLYSPLVSNIALQFYYATHSFTQLRTVKLANII
ncbi:MAG: hypothetical protein ACI4V4_02695, partial [Eubacterium sp.]